MEAPVMKKSIILILVTLLMVGSGVGVWPTPVQAAPYEFTGGGDGTALNPYIVMTDVDMNHVKDDLEAHYLQGNDIDLSNYADGAGWQPIGTEFADSFKGHFDGDGYTISGMTINSSALYIGLFGYVDVPATITNVHLEDVDITS